MRDDQQIRMLATLVVGAAYIARLVVIGNGSISALGYNLNPYVVAVAAMVMLALPETIDMMPLGPSKS